MSAMNPLTLIVGLGNQTHPGTRHSIGMMFVNKFASQLRATWSVERNFLSDIARASINVSSEPRELIFIKPRLDMNLNGRAVGRVVRQMLGSPRNINGSNLIIVHDELDKEVGQWAFKTGGSSRGHRGVESVHSALLTKDVHRLLLGIGRPSCRTDVPQYVLQKFRTVETSSLNRVFEECVDYIMRKI